MPQVTATEYVSSYDPKLLHPIPRELGRSHLGIKEDSLPFNGEDIWNAFEFSYLTQKGKPVVAIAVFRFPADSKFLIESKSFKLYLFSFHQTKFSSKEEVAHILQNDLKNASNASYVRIDLHLSTEPEYSTLFMPSALDGGYSICIDNEDVEINEYKTNPELLQFSSEEIRTESLYSNLLKTNCPLTNQPDYGTVQIEYHGRAISHASLLKYLISYREHNGFHEQCVEHMFNDILKHCQPQKLCVYARFTRRGGLDINPYRANFDVIIENTRMIRQ